MADAVYQCAVAAVVGLQGVTPGGRGVGGGLQIGVDVGTAKAVDGLLGVAHHQQRAALVGKGGFENGVLQGVGVLEFVNQGDMPVGGQCLCQCGRLRVAVA